MNVKKSNLIVLSLEESEKWDKIVQTFKDYDVYYLSGYVKAFQYHGDGQPILFYYEGQEKYYGVRGINVVMKRDIGCDSHFTEKLEKGKYFDFTTPYGYGGWLIEDKYHTGTEQLFEEYEYWCQKNNIVSEFVRFHPMLENQYFCEKSYEIIPLGETVAIELTSPEDIWNNFSSKNRNVTRKAINNSVKIYNGRYPEIYKKFIDIYNETMKRNNVEEYYYFGSEFYKSILEDLPYNAQIFYAQIPDNTIIAASVMTNINGKMNYHLSGSLRKYSDLAATNLLIYKAALWGYANGYKTLYLGGGVGSGDDTLFKFKRAFFKGNLHQFYIGKKIYNIIEYQKLLGLRTDVEVGDNFFPGYRSSKKKTTILANKI